MDFDGNNNRPQNNALRYYEFSYRFKVFSVNYQPFFIVWTKVFKLTACYPSNSVFKVLNSFCCHLQIYNCDWNRWHLSLLGSGDRSTPYLHFVTTHILSCNSENEWNWIHAVLTGDELNTPLDVVILPLNKVRIPLDFIWFPLNAVWFSLLHPRIWKEDKGWLDSSP